MNNIEAIISKFPSCCSVLHSLAAQFLLTAIGRVLFHVTKRTLVMAVVFPRSIAYSIRWEWADMTALARRLWRMSASTKTETRTTVLSCDREFERNNEFFITIRT